jgi:hypothetical protein
MRPGYAEFGSDVTELWSDLLRRCALGLVRADDTSVLVRSDRIEVAVSICGETMHASVRTLGDEWVEVETWTATEHPAAWHAWTARRSGDTQRGLPREPYYQMLLGLLKEPTERCVDEVLRGGPSPAYRAMIAARRVRADRRARAEVQIILLPVDHPIRRKKSTGDPSWEDDMIELLDRDPGASVP